jgi:hypothetical protein
VFFVGSFLVGSLKFSQLYAVANRPSPQNVVDRGHSHQIGPKGKMLPVSMNLKLLSSRALTSHFCSITRIELRDQADTRMGTPRASTSLIGYSDCC